MHTVPPFPNDRLTVIAWPDDVIDLVGHDARSKYVEKYWLGVLGPTATFLVRHVTDELEMSPSGFIMDLAETAHCMGVRGVGAHSPFVRALGRLVQFEMAQLQSNNELAVRRRIPSLSRRHVSRLSPAMQQHHEFWQRQQLTEAS